MNGFAVLCDDLTGSSVQSILLKDRGVPVRQIIRLSGSPPSPPGEGEALVINCDTRRRSREEAEKIFMEILGSFPPDIGIAKRIDTTLRGHLGSETEAILKTRPGAVAMVVPAYPSSGRTTVGGYHLLNGSLLERTEVARDPLWPISTSYVPSYFKGLLVARMHMECVKRSEEEVIVELRKLLSEGARVVVADAMTDSDIEKLASASFASKEDIIPVDPGPFTAALLSRHLSRRSPGTVLAVIGSTSEKTRKQIAWLDGKIPSEEFVFSPSETTEKAASRLREFLTSLDRTVSFLLFRPDPRVEKGSEERTARTLAFLGKEALTVLGGHVRGILLSGGDTAAMFFEAAGATALLPETEIQPLMMGGKILDGAFAGLKTVTKGGLVGEEDAIYKAALWLRLAPEATRP